MTTIAGYRVRERIYGSGTTTVYRAVSEADGTPVVLKWLSEAAPSMDEIGRFRHAYAIGRSLDLEGVARTLALTEHEHRPVLVMDDTGGESLRAILDDGRPALAWTLRVASQVARALGRLHAERLVHKDVNPSNIIVDRAGTRAVVIDFDIASRLARETTDRWSTAALQGTLDYISPEQTGRMNRSIDHRTDLYSFGVTLYEMLTGQLPFVLDDPIALVHHHIAVVPAAPRVVQEAVPEALSLLTMRLLAKTPEDRYQTAAGVAADLQRCLDALEQRGRISPFTLGTQDLAGSLRISERLYGRDDEVEHMLAAFRRAHEGRAELLLVGGYAGVGKTRLVRELHKPITADHGFFATGKFDQVTTTPYAGLIEACEQLVRDVLAESPDRIAHWRSELLVALSGAAQVVTDVIGELELVIGPQPAVSPLPAAESRNRFQRVFLRFVRAFASPSHPLVLFLDDLQWADSASLELLLLLLSDPNTTHLLVVGAFRDNEVTAGHPLMLALDALDKAGASVDRVDLAPLDRASIAELIAATLRRDVEHVLPLSDAVFARTHGNPFFVDRMLRSVHRDGALQVDPHANAWVWDLQRIEALGITDNVADLMARRISALPEACQRILHVAACIGNAFDLDTLSTVSGESNEDLAGALWPAIDAELVRPVGRAWSYVGLVGAERYPGLVEYRFVHDRIQEAAYARGDDAERRAAHLRIARLLLGDSDTPEDQRLFEVVAQYNLGSASLTDPDEKLRLARLELSAGRKALESGAYTEARAYLSAGTELLPEGAWQSQHALTFEIAAEAAQADLLLGDFDAATAGFDRCMDQAANNAERVDIHCRRIDLHTRMSDHAAAIQAGLDGLVPFGFQQPDSPEAWQGATGGEIGAVSALLEGRDLSTLVDAPECTDEDVLLELRLLAQIGTPAYTNPAVFGFVTVRVVHLSSEHGNSPDSPLAYMLYGFMLCTMGQYEAGEAFGRLALALNDKAGSPAGAAPLNHLFSVFVEHWRRPFGEVRERVVKARRLALESGIYSTAGWVVMNVPWFAYVQADPLGDALQETWTNLDIAVNTLKADDVANSIRWTLHQLLALAGQQELRDQLAADGFGEDGLFDKLAHFVPMLGAMRVQRIMRSVILGDLDTARADLAVADQLAPTFAGSVWQSEYALYSGLIATADVFRLDEASRAATDAHLGALAGWAAQCPHNHGWKHDLLAAELARIDGDEAAAASLYDQAIEAAQAGGFSHGAGLACERAAAFFALRNKSRYARGYLSDAYFAYSSWGAGEKIRQLEERFPELRPRRSGSTTTVKGTTTKDETSGFLDIATVLKATRAISRELHFDRLLGQLVSLVIENAGAQRGVLILRRRDELLIEAEGDTTSEPRVLMGRSLDEGELATSVVRFAARSHQAVVLGDATASDRYGQDTYIQRARPKSILATPILNQNQLVGVLYLENNIATEAFTDDRCALLDTISAQAAISIHNAQLYDSLERFVPSEFLACLGRPSILDVELGDAVEQHMAVLFSDIRAFTTRSATLTPQESFSFLNRYLRRVGPIIRQNNGFIDKYIGDAIMALFPGSVADALRAAERMNQEAALYSAELEAAGQEPFSIGVGVHWGKMVLGTIGEARRIEGTVISDAVNTGSRLESLTKGMGVNVIVSGEALDQVRDRGSLATRFLGETVLRGRATKTRLHELYSADAPEQVALKRATLSTFEAGVQAALAGDDAAARAHVDAVLAANPGDRAARVQRAKLD